MAIIATFQFKSIIFLQCSHTLDLLGRKPRQLISKCPFGIIVLTKQPMKLFYGLFSLPLKRGRFKKVRNQIFLK